MRQAELTHKDKWKIPDCDAITHKTHIYNSMRRYTLPYHFTRPPKRLQRARMDNIAIVPASLLFQSGKVKAAANRLPTGSVLLCQPTQERTRRILAGVATYFRSHGHQVTTLPTESFLILKRSSQ